MQTVVASSAQEIDGRVAHRGSYYASHGFSVALTDQNLHTLGDRQILLDPSELFHADRAVKILAFTHLFIELAKDSVLLHAAAVYYLQSVLFRAREFVAPLWIEILT